MRVTREIKMAENVMRVPRSKHTNMLPYYLLREGENSKQLWGRLPIPPYRATPDRVWKFTKAGAGEMTGCIVALMEANGPRAYACGFQRWDGQDAIIDIPFI